MTAIAQAYVELRPDTKNFAAQVERDFSGMGQKLTGAGLSLTRTLTPAAVGVGLAFRNAFSEFDSGIDSIRTSTGATGGDLDKMAESMKRVGNEATQPLSRVGEVMGQVAQRTGLTGKSLESLTTQLLNLERIGNEASTETVTRVFGDWGIAAEDSAGALDKLFRASQATGPSVDRLGQLLVQYGAPLRQLGFGFEDSAALMGKFEKEGVNTELVVGSLRIALGKMAREGEPAAETFKRVTEEIKNAGSASEANKLALELFGARAGPDMAAAIREGRFELGELVGQIKNGKETIKTAADDTADWGDKLAMLKNRVEGVIGPYGEMGMGLAGIAAGLGPAIAGIGSMTKFLLENKGAVLGVGAALGVAAIAVYGFAEQNARAKRNVEEFTTAVEADNGVIAKNTEALILNRFQEANLTDELNKAGLTVRDVIAAINDETGARDLLKKSLLEQGANIQTVRGFMNGLIDSTLSAVQATKNKKEAVEAMSRALNSVPDRIDTKIGVDLTQPYAAVQSYLDWLSRQTGVLRVDIQSAEMADAARFGNQASLGRSAAVEVRR